MTESLDDRAERLTRLGLQLAERIRGDPAAVKRTVQALPPDERDDLVVLALAHIPIDLPPSLLIGWWRHPHRQPQPCGTIAAARRHQRRGEQLDSACDWALHEHDRVRARERRAGELLAAENAGISDQWFEEAA